MGEIEALRGTRDILPEEVGYWQLVEATAREILSRATYREIRTPIFEQTSLFARGIGEGTDVVGKEMYSFPDRKGRSITLRPENTAGVVRALIEHKLYASSGLQRLWYIGPMFRYERPQAGRQRQFHQLGLEAIGSSDPRADAEAIAMATDILQGLGLVQLRLDLNSVGTQSDRQGYRQALVEYLTPYKDELDPDSIERLTRNPLRILDSKDKRTQEIAADAPSILDYLGLDSRRHFEMVQQLLSSLNISYKLNPRLVRGLDYYTHTAFEIISDDLGAQATVCGGGRYDGLVAELSGPQTPAVGWAIGLERLIILLQQLQISPPTAPVDFYLVSKGDRTQIQSLKLSQNLRKAGFTVELDLSGSAFKKQLGRADKSGAVACLILGDAEAENERVQLKWMRSQVREELTQADLLAKNEQLRRVIDEIKASQTKSGGERN